MITSAAFPALGGLRVIDAMHPGIVCCSPETPLRTVARLMTTYRVHAVLVTAHGDVALPYPGTWGIVSDRDLLRAAASGDPDVQTAGIAAVGPVHTVASSDELAGAAHVMDEANATHLVVLEPHSGRPIGVLSTLDIARALAGSPEHRAAHT